MRRTAIALAAVLLVGAAGCGGSPEPGGSASGVDLTERLGGRSRAGRPS